MTTKKIKRGDSMLEKSLIDFIGQCSSQNMPVVIVIKESENCFRTVLVNESEEKGDRLNMIRDLMMSGNPDDIIRDLIIHAQNHGHSSLYLKAMGVSETPQKPAIRD